MYEMLGIAGSSLSAVTKADAGQKTLSNYQTPNILYMMLPIVLFSSLITINYLYFISSKIFQGVLFNNIFLFFKVFQ